MILEKMLNAKISEGLKSDDVNFKKDLLISKKLNNFQNDLSPRLLSNNLVSAKAMKSSLNIFNLISDKMILEKILNAKISEGLKSDDINFKKACKSI